MLKQLNEEQQVLAGKHQALVQQLEQAKDSASSAAEVYKSACRAVEKRQKEVCCLSISIQMLKLHHEKSLPLAQEPCCPSAV